MIVLASFDPFSLGAGEAIFLIWGLGLNYRGVVSVSRDPFAFD